MNDETYVLRPKSELRFQGERLGLPEVYLEWSCEDDEAASPTEQSILLTQKFFDETRKELGGDAEDMKIG
jgi:hypothetical protein